MELTEDVKKALLKLPAGNIADNNTYIAHQGVMDSSIKPINTSVKMIGRAFTVACFPGDNLALHQGIYAAQPGDVLVLDCKGYDQAGHLGDIMTTACKLRRLAGIVINGSCRDKEDIRASGFPVFSKGVNPSGTVKESLATLNVEVNIGGVPVRPGDLIFGDADGVVVIPKEHEDEVIEKAFKKYNREQQILQELYAGKTTLEIYGFDRLVYQKNSMHN